LQNPYKQIKRLTYANRDCLNCEACDLRKQASRVVVSSPGMLNIAILGEGPGAAENREGIPFVGPAGLRLWKELSRYSLTRDMFHILNSVKCFPSEIRTPEDKHIEICSNKWMINEIKAIGCPLVLALGNVPRYALTGQRMGIMAVSGRMEYIDLIGARVCWSIHPSSVLMDVAKTPLFSRGIEKFVKTLAIELDYSIKCGEEGMPMPTFS